MRLFWVLYKATPSHKNAQRHKLNSHLKKSRANFNLATLPFRQPWQGSGLMHISHWGESHPSGNRPRLAGGAPPNTADLPSEYAFPPPLDSLLIQQITSFSLEAQINAEAKCIHFSDPAVILDAALKIMFATIT